MSTHSMVWKVMLLGAVSMAIPAAVLNYVTRLPSGSSMPYLPGSDSDRSTEILVLQFLAYVGFILFEAAVGLYFPTIGTLKAEIVPENVRTTMYNLFYIPMNIMISVILLAALSEEQQLWVGCFNLTISFICMVWLGVLQRRRDQAVTA